MMQRNWFSRALSHIDIASIPVSNYWHQHDVNNPSNKVFKRKMGSPFGGFVTLVYYLVLFALLLNKISSMESGESDFTIQNP